VAALGTELKIALRQLMTDVGENATFRRVTQGAYVPGTGATSGSPSNDDETVRLIFVNRNDAFANLFDSRLGVTPVEKGSRRAIILAEIASGGALSKVPEPGDQFIGVGETVTVTDAQTIRAGGATIAYVMDVSD
jgi:hypothetical protein